MRRSFRGRSKYGNRWTTAADGRKFQSAREARRYGVLRLLEAAGEIANLELQPKFPCVVNGVLVTTWRGDFRYFDKATGAVVIEDAKSKATRTEAYVVRKKLVEALYGITIVEV